MQVALIGSTGEVGQHVRKGLLEREEVRGLLTVARRKAEASHPKWRQEVWPFEDEPNWPEFPVDVAICCLGTTLKQAGSREAFKRVDHDYVLNFARWAKRNGAREFHFISALGADPEAKVFYNRVKGEAERSLRELGFDHLVIYHPSLLDSERKEQRIWERLAILVMRRINPVLRGKWSAYRSIRVEQVAQGVLRRIGTGDGVVVIPSSQI